MGAAREAADGLVDAVADGHVADGAELPERTAIEMVMPLT